jgi:hypothetical protein
MEEGGGGLRGSAYVRQVVVEVGVQTGVQPENLLVAGRTIVKGLRERGRAVRVAFAVNDQQRGVGQQIGRAEGVERHQRVQRSSGDFVPPAR